jgi:hypothetical protein
MGKLYKAFNQRMRRMKTGYALTEFVNLAGMTFGEILDHVTKIRIPVGFLEPLEITFEPCFHDHLLLTSRSSLREGIKYSGVHDLGNIQFS